MDNYAYQDDNNGKPFAIARYPTPTNGPSDYLVEVNSKSKLFRRPKFLKRLSIILLVLALILLIGLIVVIILYTTEDRSLNLCTSSECLRTAFNFKYSIDFSVDPCENFYQYTCGKWSEEHPNHGWFPTFSAFSTVTERISLAIIEFLSSESSDDEPLAVRQSRDFYRSCMDIDAINKLGLTVVYKYLQEVGLPTVPTLFTATDDEKANYKFDWLKAETVIKKTFAMDVFLAFVVENNPFNISENVMFIGSIGQPCPLPSPIKKLKLKSNSRSTNKKKDQSDEETEEMLVKITKEKIMKFVIKTIMLNATSKVPVEEDLQNAFEVVENITSYIEELVSNYTEQELTETTPMTFKNLQKKTDDYLMNNINKNYPDIWITYANHMFEGTNITIDPENDKLYVPNAEEIYLYKILAFLVDTSEIYIELYMWWVTVYAMIINTSEDIVEYIAKQTAPFYDGGTVVRSRSLDCAILVNTFMGMAVSYGIADKGFFNNTKPKVEQMLHDIKDAFMEHVNNINWMDQKTKKVTLEKSEGMLSFIGYPDWLFKNGSLDEYYKEKLTIKPDTYLGNMMAVIKTYYPEKLCELRNESKRDWRTDPTDVNAFNSFSDNAINVPMAILNFPMYNLGLEVLNYGSIGSILGHELTHGFDNIGRKHDKFGNYIQWWSNDTIETFEKLAECFINQYDNFTIEGVEGHVLGENTLGENLADNGGLNQAFTAYKKYTKKFGSEPKLPGFENFTNYQIFFIAYGSIWCETITPDELAVQIIKDEHSPNSVRVIGTLQNSEDFAKAFKCPKGSRMNPHRQKCKIW